MLLRRVIEHVKDQNWFAVGIDFAIVVIGVFVGIQVSNWNESMSMKARETELLVELESEIERAVILTEQKAEAISDVVAAGRRSLEFLQGEQACTSECWPILLDLYHASQWQLIDVNRSTYDEMRRQGLPRSRAVIDAVEGYLSQNRTLSVTNLLPDYRIRVRQLIPVEAQGYYWKNCYTLADGAETYVLDCPPGISDALATTTVETIRATPEIKLYLTEWVGIQWSTPADLRVQIDAAESALQEIRKELDTRSR